MNSPVTFREPTDTTFGWAPWLLPASKTALGSAGESVFAAVLGAQQLRTRVSENILCGKRRLDFDPAAKCVIFHLVDQGGCRVESAALPKPVALAAGDLIMFPHGHVHTLLNILSQPPIGLTDSRGTVMVCGEFTFATGHSNPILDALPDCFVLRARDACANFRTLALLMAESSKQATFGCGVVLDKLADAFFVMAVRSFIERAENRRGLLAAIFDPRMARALAAMHAQPGKHWTVASIAEIALQSRTSFAQQFSELLNISPIEYLTRWRMTEAVRGLRDPRLSVATVGERFGYHTEASFRRAFKKYHGFGPGQIRRIARLVQSQADAQHNQMSPQRGAATLGAMKIETARALSCS